MLYVFAHLSVQRTYHYFRSSVMNVVCVLANKKNVKRERKKRKRKSRDENNRDREKKALPEKKRSAKNETKIHSFSLSRPIGGVWCASVVVRILIILRITTTTTTIKASERCNNSSQKRSRKKRKKEARQGRERFFVRNKRD